MRLSDEELRTLYVRARGERRAELRWELASRVRSQLIKRLPSPTGVCAAGKRVVVDDKGPMSSGYVLHASDYSVCSCQPWTWDPDSPHRARIKRLAEEIRC